MVFVASLEKSPNEDLLTPYKFALMVCVREVCHSKNEIRKKTNSDVPWFVSQSHKRDFFMATLSLIQGPDLELGALLKTVTGVLSNALYETITSRLQEISNGGISKLMDYINCLEPLLVDPTSSPSIVHRSSIIGLFLRRMILAFDKLMFAQTIKLYHNYKEYCLSLSTNLTDDDLSAKLDQLYKVSVPTSRRQAELFVARQVALLQSNSKAAIPTRELQHRLGRLIAANPNLSEAHFLSLMNCIRAKEYCGAIHALHRTFDSNSVDQSDGKHDETAPNFRYASLNLGTILCRFGYGDEALLALNEAMTMAREAGDHACLQHALSWLYRLETDKRDLLLERSIAKAGELALPYLTSLGILMYSQIKAKSVLPAQVFEFLRKCDILNCQHSISDLTTQSFALRASLWNMYGKRKMVSLSTQLLLNLNTKEPSCSGIYLCGESLSLAFCHMAQVFSNEGKYSDAEQIINLAKEEFPVDTEYSELWIYTEQIISFERALYQGNWTVAETAVKNIAVFDKNESLIRQAEFLLYKGELIKSHEILNAILSDVQDATHEVRALILQGLCYCHGSTVSFALMPLSKALALAQKFHLRHYENVATLYIAFSQYLLNQLNNAQHLIDSLKVSIISQGYLIYRAKLSLLIGKISMKMANTQQSEPDKTETLKKAALAFEEAAENFLKVDALYFAKDSYYNQALIYNCLGCRELRNKAALQFKQVDQLCGSTTLNINDVL